MASERYLAIRLSSLGDIVHALPAVAALAEALPNAAIDWLVEARYACLLKGNPCLGRVIPLDTLGWRVRPFSVATLEAIVRGVGDLRKGVYEAAIDFQGLYKSALLARLARARERIGFGEYSLREPSAAAFYTERVHPRGCEHVIEMNLALVERLGARPGPWRFFLPSSPAAEEYVEKQLRDRAVRDFIIVNPGGGWVSKRWAPERYAELLHGLEAAWDGFVVLTYGPGEETLTLSIASAASRARVVHFPTSVSEFIALARRAKLFVGTDTGPLHLAAALGVPLVAIYGPTNPRRNGPFSLEDEVLYNHGPVSHSRRQARPGFIDSISAEPVLGAMRVRLARAHG